MQTHDTMQAAIKQLKTQKMTMRSMAHHGTEGVALSIAATVGTRNNNRIILLVDNIFFMPHKKCGWLFRPSRASIS